MHNYFKYVQYKKREKIPRRQSKIISSIKTCGQREKGQKDKQQQQNIFLCTQKTIHRDVPKVFGH